MEPECVHVRHAYRSGLEKGELGLGDGLAAHEGDDEGGAAADRGQLQLRARIVMQGGEGSGGDAGLWVDGKVWDSV